RVAGFGLGFGALFSTLGMLSYRMTIRRADQPVDPGHFPKHAWPEIQRRSDEAIAAGLEWLGDRSYSFKVLGSVSRGFSRYFCTTDRTRWYYVHCISGGKLVASYMAGLTESGRCLRVAGGMDD